MKNPFRTAYRPNPRTQSFDGTPWYKWWNWRALNWAEVATWVIAFATIGACAAAWSAPIEKSAQVYYSHYANTEAAKLALIAKAVDLCAGYSAELVPKIINITSSTSAPGARGAYLRARFYCVEPE